MAAAVVVVVATVERIGAAAAAAAGVQQYWLTILWLHQLQVGRAAPVEHIMAVCLFLGHLEQQQRIALPSKLMPDRHSQFTSAAAAAAVLRRGIPLAVAVALAISAAAAVLAPRTFVDHLRPAAAAAPPLPVVQVAHRPPAVPMGLEDLVAPALALLRRGLRVAWAPGTQALAVVVAAGLVEPAGALMALAVGAVDLAAAGLVEPVAAVAAAVVALVVMAQTRLGRMVRRASVEQAVAVLLEHRGSVASQAQRSSAIRHRLASYDQDHTPTYIAHTSPRGSFF